MQKERIQLKEANFVKSRFLTLDIFNTEEEKDNDKALLCNEYVESFNYEDPSKTKLQKKTTQKKKKPNYFQLRGKTSMIEENSGRLKEEDFFSIKRNEDYLSKAFENSPRLNV